MAGAGCSGGDGGNSNTGEARNTTSHEESKGTRSAREIDPAAQARAESLLLLLSDLPDGWRGSPSEDDDEGDEESRRCLGTDYSDFTIIGEADSDEFSMGENTSVDSEATVFESETDALGSLEEFASGMRSSKVEDCFSDAVRKEIRGEDYKLGEVDVGELSFSSPRTLMKPGLGKSLYPSSQPAKGSGQRCT